MNKKTLLICVLWALLAATISYVVLFLSLSLNLFSWRFNIGPLTDLFLLFSVILLFLNYKLAQATKEKISISFAAIVGLALVCFGFYLLWDFYSETLNDSLLGRKQLSPHWFRLSIFTYLSLPSVFLYFFSFRPYTSKN